MKLPFTLSRPAPLLLAAAGFFAVAPAQAQTANSLVQHLRFDGNTLDSSGNNNNGTASGTVSYTSGKVGASCLMLNGSTGFGSLPTTIANRTALTVSTWVYWGGGDIW